MKTDTSANVTPSVLKYQLCSSREQEITSVSGTVLKEKPLNFLQSLCDGAIAGAVAGGVVETVLYPIDTIKTRLQAAHGGGKTIFKGLYCGLSGNLIGVLPASAIFLGVYEPIKQKLLKALPDNFSALAHLIVFNGRPLACCHCIALSAKTFVVLKDSDLPSAGAIAGAASSFVRVPTEVVKQRMQTGQFATAPNAVRMIVSTEGFRGLYAGYGSFLLRDLPFDAIQFCIYEQIKLGYKLAAKRELNDPENALIGAFAGAITGAITTPLDVIKTRLMVQGPTKQYKGIYDCVNTILRKEGSHVFLKGVGPRVLWIGIGGSIFFGVLEKTKQVLSHGRPRI